jgi:ATP-dependent RNA helicase RhlE
VLKSEPIDRALVFTRTKHGADKVVKVLEKAGIASDAIHGNKSQNQRERALGAFRSGKVRVLIATDIAARGIDVDGVSHVVNFDVPNQPESYVHRIGRTARAGAEGIAISFVANDERAYLRDIEKLVKMTIPSTDRRRNPQASHGGDNGGRNGQPQGRNKRRRHRGNNPHRAEERPQQHAKPEPRNERHDRPWSGNGGNEQRPARPEQRQGHHNRPRSENGGRNGERPHQHSKPEHRQRNNNRNQTQQNGQAGQLSGVAFMNRKPKRRGGQQHQPRPAQ